MKITDLFPKKPKIFISYRQETSSCIARVLAEKLKDKFNVCYDQNPSNQRSGDVWKDILEKDIKECKYFILVVDEGTFNFKTSPQRIIEQKIETNQEFEKQPESGKQQEGEYDKDYVLEEIECALERKNNNEDIKIIPFMVKGKEMPKEIIKQYNLNGLDGNNMHRRYENEPFDDFISRFLEQKMGYNFNIEKWKKVLKYSLLVVFSAALCAFAGTLLQQWYSSRTPKLIFAGGGSVANMIKKMTGDAVDVKDYKNSIYLNLPSQDSWVLMPEEVMINHTSDTVLKKFYPVCLSALEADSSAFIKIVKEKQFVENGTVISYRLKENDELIVYSNKFQGDQKTITIDDLQIIIEEWCKNDTSFKVYVTNEKSGTYYSYQKELKVNFDSTSYRNRRVFYDEKLRTNELVDSGSKCIILSSRYYTPGDISKYLKSRKVVSDNGEPISKPMYLYFAGYRKADGTITIPEQMVRFLKQIDKDANIKTKMNQKIRKVITPYDLLVTWQ